MIVTFRPLREADGPRVLEWRNTPAVAAHMYTDHFIQPAEHSRWLAAALSSPDRAYWIIQADGTDVGLANLAGIDPANGRCELGHYISDPAMRGRGVGAATEYILLQHVFETLKLNKLWCEVLAENEAAWRLHPAFGFQREALFRDHVRKSGRFHDVIGLGIRAADWAAARPDCEARLRARGMDPANLVVLDG